MSTHLSLLNWLAPKRNDEFQFIARYARSIQIVNTHRIHRESHSLSSTSQESPCFAASKQEQNVSCFWRVVEWFATIGIVRSLILSWERCMRVKGLGMCWGYFLFGAIAIAITLSRNRLFHILPWLEILHDLLRDSKMFSGLTLPCSLSFKASPCLYERISEPAYDPLLSRFTAKKKTEVFPAFLHFEVIVLSNGERIFRWYDRVECGRTCHSELTLKARSFDIWCIVAVD